MKTITRIRTVLTIFLLLAMISSLLVSCGGGGGTEISDETVTTATDSGATTTEKTEETTGNALGGSLKLVTKTFTPKIIVSTSLDEDDAVYVTAKRLETALNNNFTVQTEVKDDYLISGTTHDSDTIEILVGDTNYGESTVAFEGENIGDWFVKVVGHKLVISSRVNTGINTAVNQFVIWMKKNISKEDGSLTIPENFKLSGSASTIINAIPYTDEMEVEAVLQTDYYGYLWQVCYSDASTYREGNYKALLEENGYVQYSEYTQEDNIYRTFTKGEYNIHTAYTGFDHRLHVTAELASKTTLPELTNTYVRKDVCTETLTQIGDEFLKVDTWDEYINGMSYVWRLDDGSFIIEDGGNNRAETAKILYDVLVKQAVDPDNIVIAAWIFSHGHGDHTGCIQAFAKEYADKVTVEQFIYEFPDENNGSAGSDMDDGVFTAMEKWPDAVHHICHPGQIYYVRSATIKVLYTIDLLYPTDIDFFNETSTSYYIELAGKTFLMSGDMGPISSQRFVKMYPNTMSADFVQVIHHGFKGANPTYYRLAKGKYMLYPTGNPDTYVGTSYYTGNDWFLQKSGDYYVKTENVEEVFIAEDNIYVINLSGDVTWIKYEQKEYLGYEYPYWKGGTYINPDTNYNSTKPDNI